MWQLGPSRMPMLLLGAGHGEHAPAAGKTPIFPAPNFCSVFGWTWWVSHVVQRYTRLRMPAPSRFLIGILFRVLLGILFHVFVFDDVKLVVLVEGPEH